MHRRLGCGSERDAPLGGGWRPAAAVPQACRFAADGLVSARFWISPAAATSARLSVRRRLTGWFGRGGHGRNIHPVRGNDFGDQFRAAVARGQVPVQAIALGIGQPSVDICRDQAQVRTTA